MAKNYSEKQKNNLVFNVAKQCWNQQRVYFSVKFARFYPFPGLGKLFPIYPEKVRPIRPPTIGHIMMKDDEE